METKALANSLDALFGTEREEITPIIIHVGVYCTSAQKLLLAKSHLRLGTWNIRTMYEQGRCAQVVKEMKRYNLSVPGVSEMRWNTFSGMQLERPSHTLETLMKMISMWRGWVLFCQGRLQIVSEQIITARFASKCQVMSIIQVYAAIYDATEEEESFHHQLKHWGTSTIFPHKPCLKATWWSPDARSENQIDHITTV